MRNLEELNGIHKGKSCVILGAGPSLYSEKENLFLLDKFITIAVNSGYVAYESDYFVSDDHEVAVWSYFMHNLRKSKKTQVLLYEDRLADKAHLFGDRAILFRHRTGYYLTPKYEHENKLTYVTQCRSSLGSAIHIAHIMKCKDMLILGLDCCRVNKYRWFWQMPGWKSPPRRLDGRRVDNYRWRRDGLINTDSDLMDILAYWQKYGTEINKKCTVYNGSSISQVTVFPKKSLKEFAEERLIV